MISRADIQRLVAEVAEQDGVTLDELRGRSHARALVHTRTRAARLARDRGASYPEIGRAMGRDHASVIHLLKTEGLPYGKRSKPSQRKRVA